MNFPQTLSYSQYLTLASVQSLRNYNLKFFTVVLANKLWISIKNKSQSRQFLAEFALNSPHSQILKKRSKKALKPVSKVMKLLWSENWWKQSHWVFFLLFTLLFLNVGPKVIILPSPSIFQNRFFPYVFRCFLLLSLYEITNSFNFFLIHTPSI